MNIGSLRQLFAAEIDEVDAALAEYLATYADPPGHYGLIRYHLGFADERLAPTPGARQPRGKRLRAIVCMLIGRAIGAPRNALTTLMLASEMLHNASLVHDDIEDEEPLRWGRPTVWSLSGTSQAINIGDALIGMTFDLLLRLRQDGVPPDVVHRVLESYVRAYLRMGEGQHLDLLQQARLDIGVDRYLDMISRKTGAALEGFCGATAIVGGGTAQVEGSYRRFGAAFGMLYQIMDDIGGVWGELDDTGKIAARDIMLRKTTLPLLYGVEHGSPALRKLLLEPHDTKAAFTEAESEHIVAELAAVGVEDLCRAVALRHRDAALAELRGAGDGAAEQSREHMMLAKMVEVCAQARPRVSAHPEAERV